MILTFNQLSKKYYVCEEYGSEATKWQGKCLDYNSWNSYKEIFVQPNTLNTSDTFYMGKSL